MWKCHLMIWGSQMTEKTTTVSHFLGTIARNGRYCPLQYADWRLIHGTYKDEMKRIVKAEFDLPPGHDAFILKSINKKWRNWKCTLKSLNFDPNVAIEEQMLEIPKGVNEDQYKKLVEHWLSDKSMGVCEKNKQTLAKLEFLHRMGKRSFAIIRKTMDKMEELASHNPDNLGEDVAIPSSNDEFAQVMGKDKDGQVCMYGLGVKSTDVYGGKPSRDALDRKNMDYEMQFKVMNEQIQQLTALVHGRSHSNEQPELEVNRVLSPNARSNHRSSSPTLPNNHNSSTSTSRSLRIRAKSRVVLKKFGNMDEIVVSGIVLAMNGVRANGMDLGDDFCEVSIQRVMKPEVKLFFGPDQMETMDEALGAPIPWHVSLVALEDDDMN